MKLNEIIYGQLPEISQDKINIMFDNSEFLEELTGYEFRKTIIDNQEYWFYSVDQNVIAYLIIIMNHDIQEIPRFQITNTYQNWYLKQLWVQEDYRRKGFGKDLILAAKKEKEILIIDYRISYDAFDLIKKLIDTNAVTARIVNLDTGDTREYDSATANSLDEKETFLLEDYTLHQTDSLEILQPMILLNYRGLKI